MEYPLNLTKNIRIRKKDQIADMVHSLIKRPLFIIWWNFLILSLCGVVQGEASSSITTQRLETKYTIIHYQSLKDLKKFNHKVDYSPGEWGLKQLFSRSRSEKEMRDKLKNKVDALFERAQEILDMRKKMEKVTIKIYPNTKQLHAVYARIYKISSQAYKVSRPPRAWYIYEYNTIYINVGDLHEGMLAHEMAHFIIDNYLTVRPPGAAAEILARYVDSHLFE